MVLGVQRQRATMSFGPHNHGTEGEAVPGRESLRVHLVDGDGREQTGEAAPLAGYSPDSLEQAEAELCAWRDVPISVPALPLPQVLEALSRSELSEMGSPSARFAIEAAVAQLGAARLGLPLWRMFTTEPPASLSVARVVDGTTPVSELNRMDAAFRQTGCQTTFKVKIGVRPFEQDLEFLTHLRQSFPQAVLRVDANQRLTTDWETYLTALLPLDLEWIEELVDPSALWDPSWAPQPLLGNLAVDESLRVFGNPENRRIPEGVGAVVLKPTCLGLHESFQWASAARSAGREVLVSHTLEPGPTRELLPQLAFAWMDSDQAAGLGPFPGELGDAMRFSLPTWDSEQAALDEERGRVHADLSLRDFSANDLERVAVRGVVHWSFHELASKVASCRARLHAALEGQLANGGPCRVAFVARRDPATLVLLYALVESGICAVPLHSRWTQQERQRALERVPVDLFVNRPEDWTSPCAKEAPAPRRDDRLRMSDPFAIVLTSGSTGQPKAVQLSRGAVVASAAMSLVNLPQAEHDCWLLAMPLAHVGALSVLTRSLRARGAIALMEDGRFDPERVWEFIVQHGVTHASLVPTQLRRLLQLEGPAAQPLRLVLLGGAAASGDVIDKARAKGIEVRTSYGMTETFGQVISAGAEEQSSAFHAAGRTLPGVSVRIRTPDADGVGELELKSPSLMDGYILDGVLQVPFVRGWFATGDRASLEDGGVVVRGRNDDCIVTGGENVDPLEVERVLAGVAGVDSVSVVSLPDADRGEIVVAAFVGDVTVAALEQAITALAPFKRPRQFRRLRALPLGSSGKVDRNALRTELCGDGGGPPEAM